MDGTIGNDYSFALDGHTERDADHAWSVNSYRAGNWTRFVKSVYPSHGILSDFSWLLVIRATQTCALTLVSWASTPTQPPTVYVLVISSSSVHC